MTGREPGAGDEPRAVRLSRRFPLRPSRAIAVLLVLTAAVPAAGETAEAGRSVTVVAVVDSGFTPYHIDFVGSYHPWNTDADPGNDIDLTADPATYVTGYPGATPIDITVPLVPGENVSNLRAGPDAPAWEAFETSDGDNVVMHRFPGTKIIGAISFAPEFYGDNSSHGTRSAATAAGNIHGTCPECLVVLIAGNGPAGLKWAASQPWIDVITNSYGHNTLPRTSRTDFRDNIYFDSPVSTTRASSEAGQVITFSAGNGFLNAYDVPMFTYWSSEKGPDWMVTVGAVDNNAQQNFYGSGKPVDISSIGDQYPSTGGRTAGGVGTHSGTSAASPAVAGTIARVLQRAREILGDRSNGYADGVVAQGAAIPCGAAIPGCALEDGTLTRRELVEAVYHSVLPIQGNGSPVAQTLPTTEHAYYYVGHGVVRAKSKNAEESNAEVAHMVDVLLGARKPFARPAGEATWFAVDSECRQKLWGSWSGGYYTGTAPQPTPADPLALAFHAWCSQAPNDTFDPLTP